MREKVDESSSTKCGHTRVETTGISWRRPVQYSMKMKKRPDGGSSGVDADVDVDVDAKLVLVLMLMLTLTRGPSCCYCSSAVPLRTSINAKLFAKALKRA